MVNKHRDNVKLFSKSLFKFFKDNKDSMSQSKVYEFLSQQANHPSWNHYSDDLNRVRRNSEDSMY